MPDLKGEPRRHGHGRCKGRADLLGGGATGSLAPRVLPWRRYKIKAYAAYAAPYIEVRHRGWSAGLLPRTGQPPDGQGGCLFWPSFALQVMSLDSDAVPLMDPGVMFETTEYKEAGNLFFPDRGVPICGNPRLYDVLHITNPQEGKDPRQLQVAASICYIFADHASRLHYNTRI